MDVDVNKVNGTGSEADVVLTISCGPLFPSIFKFKCTTTSESEMTTITSMEQLQKFVKANKHEEIYMYFDNDICDGRAMRSCWTYDPISILVNENAKFDKLHIKGFMDGHFYETTLDSIESVSAVLSNFDSETNYIRIFEFAKTLIFEIL